MGLDRSFGLQEVEDPKISRQGYQLYGPAAFTTQKVPLVTTCLRR
jgi:hypothetical protein